jgi:cytidylate kinase
MKSRTTFIITIDGTSGSGKSTISKLLAKKLNFILLDSGKLYRSAGYIVSKSDTKIDATINYKKLISQISLKPNENTYEYEVCFKNQVIDQYLYTDDVAKAASVVSKISEVRECMFNLQQSCVKGAGLIANGRDMGTEVFPDAPLKIYIDADLEIRAKRRLNELLDKGENVTFENIYDSLMKRDDSDMNRELSPLKIPNNGHILDTSHLKPDAIVDKILNLYTITSN